MAIKFIKAHPRMTYLLLGFLLGMVLVGANQHWAAQTITEYKRIAREKEVRYEELLEKSYTEIETLSRVNETLKKKTVKSKITKPDGTITEKEMTDSDSNKVSEVSIRQTIEIEFEKKLSIEREKHIQELNKVEQRKLRLGVGITTDLKYYGHGSYNVWGPLSIGGGATSDGVFLFDIGINL